MRNKYKAPWAVNIKSGAYGEDYSIVDCDGNEILNCSYVNYEGGGNSPVPKNERLILRAPQMFNAIESVLAEQESGNPDRIISLELEEQLRKLYGSIIGEV